MKLKREVSPPEVDAASCLASGILHGVIIFLFLVGVVTLFGAGCCGVQKPVHVVTEMRGCVTAPPPARPHNIAIEAPDAACMKEWEFCMTTTEAGKLWTYIQDLERWANSAWINCQGETP